MNIMITPAWKTSVFQVWSAARWRLELPRPVAFDRIRREWDVHASMRDHIGIDVRVTCTIDERDYRRLIINVISGLPAEGTISVKYRPAVQSVANSPTARNPSSSSEPDVRSA